jgi:hypothetical protein
MTSKVRGFDGILQSLWLKPTIPSRFIYQNRQILRSWGWGPDTRREFSVWEFPKSQKRFRNSPDVQPGRYCPCWLAIIRPRRLCRESCANGPQLQGLSAKVHAKAEDLGADTLQVGTISGFNWITCISTEAGRLDYYKAFLPKSVMVVFRREGPDHQMRILCSRICKKRNRHF